MIRIIKGYPCIEQQYFQGSPYSKILIVISFRIVTIPTEPPFCKNSCRGFRLVKIYKGVSIY